MSEMHDCPNEKGTVKVFVGEPELKTESAVQFVEAAEWVEGKQVVSREWCLWCSYDDGCWIPIDYCPYCGIKLAGTEGA